MVYEFLLTKEMNELRITCNNLQQFELKKILGEEPYKLYGFRSNPIMFMYITIL